MNNNTEFVGSVFNSINYTSLEHLEMFLSNLTIEQSFYVLNEALEYSNSKGSFSLLESEIVSKALRTLNKEVLNKNIVEKEEE